MQVLSVGKTGERGRGWFLTRSAACFGLPPVGAGAPRARMARKNLVAASGLRGKVVQKPIDIHPRSCRMHSIESMIRCSKCSLTL